MDELEPLIKIKEEEFDEPYDYEQPYLNQHIPNVHETKKIIEIDPLDNENKPYACKFCNHRCGTKSGIVDHTRRNHEG